MCSNAYQAIENIFNGKYLDINSLFENYYLFSNNNLKNHDIYIFLSQYNLEKYAIIFIEKEFTLNKFLNLTLDDINYFFPNILLGPKIAIKNIIKIYNIINTDFGYLMEFDEKEYLKEYKYLFLKLNIDRDIFIRLNINNLLRFKIPKGTAYDIIKAKDRIINKLR